MLALVIFLPCLVIKNALKYLGTEFNNGHCLSDHLFFLATALLLDALVTSLL